MNCDRVVIFRIIVRLFKIVLYLLMIHNQRFVSRSLCVNTHFLRKIHEANGACDLFPGCSFRWLRFEWVLNVCQFEEFVPIFICESIKKLLFIPLCVTQQDSCGCCRCRHLCTCVKVCVRQSGTINFIGNDIVPNNRIHYLCCAHFLCISNKNTLTSTIDSTSSMY